MDSFGTVRHVHAGEQTSFFINQKGLHALGCNDHGRLGLGRPGID